MNGQNVGYIRVSSLLQNEARQLDGKQLDTVFTDKVSGRDRNRPQLIACMQYVRAGDTLHVHSIDRLARSLNDLESIVKELTAKGVSVIFHKEKITLTGNDNPMTTLMLQIMGACAQFELSLIKERQREGIAIAKKQGRQIGRKRKYSVLPDFAGMSKTEAATKLGISRTTLWTYLKKENTNAR